MRSRFLVLFLTLLWLAPAQGADDPPDKRLYLYSQNVLRGNPIGLQSQNQFMFQKRLMDSESPLFNSTFIEVGALNRISPAFITGGVGVNIKPIALLQLNLGVEAIQYFGGFDQILSFDTPDQDYSDATQEARSEAGENYATNGVRAFGKLRFQVKVKKIALINEVGMEHWNLNLTDGGKYFYEFTTDVLAPANGWMLTNDINLLYFVKFGAIGLRHSLVKPFYEDPTEGLGNPHQRGGLVAIIPLKDKEGGISKPQLLAIANVYINHRYRDFSTADTPLPYVLLGFRFNWDARTW